MSGKDERADQPQANCTTVNIDTLNAGIRFPLHSVISRLLNEWKISLTQLHPNGWQIIMGILTLFVLENYSAFPCAAKLATLIPLVDSQGKDGWYHLKSHPGEKLVEGLQGKIKDWKKKFLFLGCDWLSSAHPYWGDSRMDVPTDYQWARKEPSLPVGHSWDNFDDTLAEIQDRPYEAQIVDYLGTTRLKKQAKLYSQPHHWDAPTGMRIH